MQLATVDSRRSLCPFLSQSSTGAFGDEGHSNEHTVARRGGQPGGATPCRRTLPHSLGKWASFVYIIPFTSHATPSWPPLDPASARGKGGGDAGCRPRVQRGILRTSLDVGMRCVQRQRKSPKPRFRQGFRPRAEQQHDGGTTCRGAIGAVLRSSGWSSGTLAEQVRMFRHRGIPPFGAIKKRTPC